MHRSLMVTSFSLWSPISGRADNVIICPAASVLHADPIAYHPRKTKSVDISRVVFKLRNGVKTIASDRKKVNSTSLPAEKDQLFKSAISLVDEVGQHETSIASRTFTRQIDFRQINFCQRKGVQYKGHCQHIATVGQINKTTFPVCLCH